RATSTSGGQVSNSSCTRRTAASENRTWAGSRSSDTTQRPINSAPTFLITRGTLSRLADREGREQLQRLRLRLRRLLEELSSRLEEFDRIPLRVFRLTLFGPGAA